MTTLNTETFHHITVPTLCSGFLFIRHRKQRHRYSRLRRTLIYRMCQNDQISRSSLLLSIRITGQIGLLTLTVINRVCLTRHRYKQIISGLDLSRFTDREIIYRIVLRLLAVSFLNIEFDICYGTYTGRLYVHTHV